MAASLLVVLKAWNENGLGVGQLTTSRTGITDDEITEILRRGRFEDIPLVAAIAG